MSWLVRYDVQSARRELNFSQWDEYADEAEDAVEQVTSGAMPPDRYTLLHPDANLSDAEVAELAAALRAMDQGRGGDNSGPGGGGGEDNSGRGGG
jgi:hypothetical protein